MSLGFACALILATVPGSAPPVKPAASAAQIEKLTADGKAEQAIDEGRPAVVAHPDDVDLRLALARALAAKARRVKRIVNVPVSQRDVDRGQVAVPTMEFGRAPVQVDYDPALFDEVMLHLDAAIQRAPKRQDLRVFKCFLLTDAGRIEGAKAAIASALGALPKTSELATTMAAYGVERAKRGDAAGGAQLLAPVAGAFPSNGSVLVDYANLLTRIGRKTEAFAILDRATALAPNEPRYARTKAVSAMLLRDYKRAQNAFDDTFRLGRDAADQFASYAAAYGADPRAGAELMHELAAPSASRDPAVADFANQFVLAAKRGPSSPEAMSLARKLSAAQQYVFAIPVLDRAARADAKNAEAKTMLKSAYQALGCGPLAP